MSQGIEAITTAAIGLALDAASLRQRAYASNIANASTPGYVPVRVGFESQLAEAAATLESRGRLDAAALADVRPVLEHAPLDAMGLPAKVQLDVEVASMSQNAAHYQALVKALQRSFSVLSLAVTEGKR